MQHILRTLVIAITLICAQAATAQRYVADPFNRDSVAVMELTRDNGVGTEAFRIAKGDTVTVLGPVEGFPDYGVASFGGTKYAVSVMEFRIIADDGAEDPWETATARWRSPQGRYYSTLPPYMLIVGLVICALLLGLAGRRVGAVRKIALIFMPLMIAGACYIEISAYLALHTDMFWWCDEDRYGFWGSVLRVIPFSAVLVAQVLSYPVYGRLMLQDGGEDDAAVGSILPMAISFLVSLPVVGVVLLVCAMFHMGQPMQAVVGTCVFFAVVGIGSFTSIAMNISSFGFFKGLWLSLFGAVYIVGAMIAVLGLGIALWNIFVQIVITLAPYVIAIALLAGKPHETAVTPDGRMVTGWTDGKGIFHASDGRKYRKEK